MSEVHTPPFFWTEDQQRAWRLIAASWQHDGALFDRVLAETREAGPDAVDKLFASLARNFVVRLRMSMGADALDALIDAELCAGIEELERTEDGAQ